MVADRALIKAARGFITYQGTEQADSMIYMMLYLQKNLRGSKTPRRYLHDGPRAVT